MFSFFPGLLFDIFSLCIKRKPSEKNRDWLFFVSEQAYKFSREQSNYFPHCTPEVVTTKLSCGTSFPNHTPEVGCDTRQLFPPSAYQRSH